MLRHLTNENQARRILSALADQLPAMFPQDQQTTYVIEVVDAEEKRTVLQNRYLWGWVYPQLSEALTDGGISHPSGEPYSPTLVRLELAVKFRQCGSIVQDGFEYPDYKSTGDMGKKEFAAFVESANRYYIERDQVGIPDHRDNEYYANVAREIGIG